MHIKRFFRFAIVFIIIISGCSTFPKPSSKTDTLLIIPIGLNKKSSAGWFGRYKVYIKNTKTNSIVKTVILPVKNGFTTIEGIAPGEYSISGTEFVYNNTSSTHKSSKNNNYIPFTLYPNKITILNKKFIYKIWNAKGNSSKYQYFMDRDWHSLSAKEKESLIKSISDNKNFSLWNME